jgi:hypothetical protein
MTEITEQQLISAPEHEIIRQIVTEQNVGWYFEFMISAALGDRSDRRGQDWVHQFMCAINRSALGLKSYEKPGDIDVLIVPRYQGRWFASKAMAVEVKVLRLPKSNRDKHPRPSGRKQAEGLLRDGFPYVGLLHLIVAEPSPSAEWKRLMHAKIIDDHGRVEVLGEFPTDTIATATTRRQYGRLLQLARGSFFGVGAVGLVLNNSGTAIAGNSTLNTFTQPARNPNADDQLIERIGDLCEWFSRSGRVLQQSRTS